MANRIRDVSVTNHRLDPVETELRILVEVEELTPTTEIKGRLMGPRCEYASTVEIAYPMREVERGLELRVVVPEPSWWEPETPFLYQGPLELWQDGEIVDRMEVSHGIRSLQLTPLGLRLNGLPFVLRGKAVEPTCSEAEMRRLRGDGINTVISSIADSGGIDLWRLADRYGLFVLGYSEPSAAEFMRWQNELEKHASAFAWAFCHSDLMSDPILRKPGAMFYGVATAGTRFPPNASFVICNEGDPNANQEIVIPKVMATKHLPDPLPARPDVIGWIELPS